MLKPGVGHREHLAIARSLAKVLIAAALVTIGGIVLTESARLDGPANLVVLSVLTTSAFQALRAAKGGRYGLRRMARWRLRLPRRQFALPLIIITGLLYTMSAGFGLATFRHSVAASDTAEVHFQISLAALWSRGILTPMLEEFALRGWAQPTLERTIGVAPAVGLVAVVFAWLHDTSAGFPWNIAMAGAVLGIIAHFTRSIWASVAVHAGNNLIALLLPTQFPRWGIADGQALARWAVLESTERAATVAAVVSSILLAAMVGYLASHARRPQSSRRRES